jgi:phenylacetate-CoA ligase
VYSFFLERLALPALGRFTPSRYWEAYREMMRLERRSAAEQAEVQARRLRHLVEHAFSRVPHYREAADRHGIDPATIREPSDLRRLPVLTKEEVQAAFPDRITAEGMDRADWRFLSTSGTANRLMVIQDFGKRDLARAAEARAFHLGGGYRAGERLVEIPPDVCNIACGIEGESLDGVLDQLWLMTRRGSWRDEKEIRTLRGRVERNWVYRKRTYPPFDGRGTDQTAEALGRYVEMIRRDRPHLLKALPTYLHQIARHVVEGGIDPLPVRVVQPMGGSVVPAVRQLIERAVTGTFREQYGSGEFGAMGCDCERDEGIHVFTDLFVVEVVDPDGEPCGEGELGRILVTDLANRAMPLLRYQIGDVGRLETADHGCGRPGPRLHVEGRLEDALVRPDGRILSSDAVCEHLYRRGDVEHFQLMERGGDRFELMAAPRNGRPLATEELARDVARLLGGEPRIDVFAVETIRPEESGKYRFVHSRSWSRM